MYRQFTFRLTHAPLPLTRYTGEHPDVRVIAWPVSRDPNFPLPNESIYLIRAPQHLHPEIDAIVAKHLEVVRRLDIVEPEVLAIHAKYPIMLRGEFSAFLRVLTAAVGTILEFRPIIMEQGTLTATLLAIPRGDSTIRLRSLEDYARDQGIGFQMTENRPVPTPDVAFARGTILDLLEWQVIQAMAGAGLYDGDNPDAGNPTYAAAIEADVAEVIGLERREVDEIRRMAEQKVLQEFSDVHSLNLLLNTRPVPPVIEEIEIEIEEDLDGGGHRAAATDGAAAGDAAAGRDARPDADADSDTDTSTGTRRDAPA